MDHFYTRGVIFYTRGMRAVGRGDPDAPLFTEYRDYAARPVAAPYNRQTLHVA